MSRRKEPFTCGSQVVSDPGAAIKVTVIELTPEGKQALSAPCVPSAIPPSVATADDWPDEIRDLGDKIAKLMPAQAGELLRYLEDKGGKW